MTEEFLQFVWKMRLLDNNLTINSGEAMEILHPGQLNNDAGPDFTNARIRIGDTLWAGNVEIHVNASDWYAHKHASDHKYDNIILHVVYHDDLEVTRQNGEVIPVLLLKGRFDETLFRKYRDLMENLNWVPCQRNLEDTETLAARAMTERALIYRLERKTDYLSRLLNVSRNNWEETLYRMLARNFGFKTNAEPFEQLAASLPYLVIARHRSDLFQLEALLYGQAGMLQHDFRDEYPVSLKREYMFLQKKWGLEPVGGHLWKYLRMRPANFPSVRISQFARLMFDSDRLFARITDAEDVKEVDDMLDITASEYWDEHYVFDKLAPRRVKLLGERSRLLILINTVIPFMFYYGRITGKENLVDRSLHFLETLPPENNKVIRKWTELGLACESAFDSQA